MKKVILILLFLTLLFWWFQDPTITDPETEISFDYTVRHTGNASENSLLPLLIVLHGNGDNPAHFFDTALDELATPSRVILLKAPIPMGWNGSAWPMEKDQLQRYAKAISGISKRLTVEYYTLGQPMVFGFSGGGVMAYYLAGSYPDQYSYIIPISGKLSADMLPDSPHQSASVEVTAFHGTQDNVIGISGGRNANQLLLDRNIKSQLFEFNGGHLGLFTSEKKGITALLEKKIQSLK